MIEVIRSWTIKLFAKLLPFVFRWIYTHEKLASLIDVTISSEGDGIVIDCLELPSARVWIEIINLSPFKFKLVGIEAVLYWVGRAADFQSLQRVNVLPHSKQKLLIEGSLNEHQVTHIKKNHTLDKPRLNIKLYFVSSLRDIGIQKDMNTANVRMRNC